MVPIKLDQETFQQVLRSVVGADGQEYAASRICRRLAGGQGVRTRTVNVDCSVGNISDIVNKSINPYISHLGLYVACARPVRPFENRYKQRTSEVLWGIYADAANDSDYDNLDADLDELADQHPELLTDGPGDEQAADAWEHDLFGSGK
jgi:hypothetical protein